MKNQDGNITYAVTKSFRKTITLRILPDGKLQVQAPRFTPDSIIRQFVLSKKNWIEKKQTELLFYQKKPTVSEGDELLYLGQRYKFTFASVVAIKVHSTMLQFPRSLAFRTTKELQQWYLREARKIITERLVANAERMSVRYNHVYFSDTSSKWGSCSPTNELQFNWRLVMAPLLVLNYVVIHELAHIIEKNHSRAFWSIVEKYNPSYKQQRTWLKEHGHILHSTL